MGSICLDGNRLPNWVHWLCSLPIVLRAGDHFSVSGFVVEAREFLDEFTPRVFSIVAWARVVGIESFPGPILNPRHAI